MKCEHHGCQNEVLRKREEKGGRYCSMRCYNAENSRRQHARRVEKVKENAILRERIAELEAEIERLRGDIDIDV